MKPTYLLLLALLALQTSQAQIVNIPDANFKARLLLASPGYIYAQDLSGNYVSIDTNSDGEIQVNEALQIAVLQLEYAGINDLTGIESFSNLEELNCANNTISTLDFSSNVNLHTLLGDINSLTDVDLTQNINLANLDLGENNLTNVDISNNINLVDLLLNNNQISTIDISNLVLIEHFNITSNNLTSLDVSNNTLIKWLSIGFNSISNIDTSNLSQLNAFFCYFNAITSLDLSANTIIEGLYCNSNLINSLDISQNPSLMYMALGNNELITLNLKNGNTNNVGQPNFLNGNDNLQYICADDFEINSLQYRINVLGYNTSINTYCSFVPGGEYYNIIGQTTLDNNVNGCDINDGNYPNLKFNITDGINNGSFFADNTGNYSIPVQEGTHTITPVMENLYYSVTPASLVIDFPTETSPYTQDFCITPNGTYNDLEITILPLEDARPGFDTDYKLSYKNKGTTTLSGSVDLMFQDDVMDLVSATPVADSQSINNLSWNYTNLAPFETGEILFTMNLNAPTETPPVNEDDILTFTTTINPTTGDETPDDNVFTLNQLVVNSYDPNDKTCLEGSTITPDLIGEYVHYIIRFENTGTANAINVVVKDIIDTDKFDIATLFLSDTSHDVDTRITGNKVEFIFENINLPFDDATNDGYIAFKIKTLNTLVEGDTFENDAEIYFDYNFPILTNVAQTTIESTLGTTDNELLNLEIYPNPVQDVLNIQAKDSLESITIYDISGRLINRVALIGNTNDVIIKTNDLSSGTYFVKVKTEIGESVRKFIKD